MKRQNVIILIYPDKEPICRGNFKKICEEFGFPYHSLKMKDFPIFLNDATIYRVPFL
jgi:hypothetical protein